VVNLVSITTAKEFPQMVTAVYRAHESTPNYLDNPMAGKGYEAEITIKNINGRCEAVIDLGTIQRNSADECLNAMTWALELIAKALRERNPAPSSIPIFNG
jgi:hypothetical protein